MSSSCRFCCGGPARAPTRAVPVRTATAGLRDVVELPILWRGPGRPADASAAGADAWIEQVPGSDEDGHLLAAEHADAVELGLDCVVEVHNEEEFELALERLDPESTLFRVGSDGADPLRLALDLLPAVPAGKLAVAEVA